MNIRRHIDELIAEIDRLIDARTYETPDPLSVSIWEYGDSLKALNEQEEELENFIDALTRP